MGGCMIDHISIAVRDIKKAEAFYTALLAPLGLAKLREWAHAAVGYGKTYPEFWINSRSGMIPAEGDGGVHVCLRASSTKAVNAFMPPRLQAAARPMASRGFVPNTMIATTPRLFAIRTAIASKR